MGNVKKVLPFIKNTFGLVEFEVGIKAALKPGKVPAGAISLVKPGEAPGIFDSIKGLGHAVEELFMNNQHIVNFFV